MTEVEIIQRLKTTEDEDEAKTLLQALKEKNTPKCGTCENWEQQDTLTPNAGRCSKVQKGGANMVTFEDEECQVQTESEVA